MRQLCFASVKCFVLQGTQCAFICCFWKLLSHANSWKRLQHRARGIFISFFKSQGRLHCQARQFLRDTFKQSDSAMTCIDQTQYHIQDLSEPFRFFSVFSDFFCITEIKEVSWTNRIQLVCTNSSPLPPLLEVGSWNVTNSLWLNYSTIQKLTITLLAIAQLLISCC